MAQLTDIHTAASEPVKVKDVHNRVLNVSDRVFRYIDLGRLLDILAKKRLPLVRTDLMNDEVEGAIPAGLAKRLARLGGVLAPSSSQEFESGKWYLADRSIRKRTWISSWCQSPNESYAMWRVYSGDRDGVAISTTLERLLRAFQPLAIPGVINYVDSNHEGQGTPIPAAWFTYKRREFEYEAELRFIHADATSDAAPKVKYVPVDPTQLLDEIVLSPFLEPWTAEAVTATIRSLGVLCNIRESAIKASASVGEIEGGNAVMMNAAYWGHKQFGCYPAGCTFTNTGGYYNLKST